MRAALFARSTAERRALAAAAPSLEQYEEVFGPGIIVPRSSTRTVTVPPPDEAAFGSDRQSATVEVQTEEKKEDSESQPMEEGVYADEDEEDYYEGARNEEWDAQMCSVLTFASSHKTVDGTVADDASIVDASLKLIRAKLSVGLLLDSGSTDVKANEHSADAIDSTTDIASQISHPSDDSALAHTMEHKKPKMAATILDTMQSTDAKNAMRGVMRSAATDTILNNDSILLTDEILTDSILTDTVDVDFVGASEVRSLEERRSASSTVPLATGGNGLVDAVASGRVDDDQLFEFVHELATRVGVSHSKADVSDEEMKGIAEEHMSEGVLVLGATTNISQKYFGRICDVRFRVFHLNATKNSSKFSAKFSQRSTLMASANSSAKAAQCSYTEVSSSKTLLALHSEVFGALFYEGTVATTTTLPITDCSVESLHVLNRYVFGQFDKSDSPLTLRNIGPVLYTADKYGVNGLKKCCDDWLTQELDEFDAYHFVLILQSLECAGLKEMSETLVSTAAIMTEPEKACALLSLRRGAGVIPAWLLRYLLEAGPRLTANVSEEFKYLTVLKWAKKQVQKRYSQQLSKKKECCKSSSEVKAKEDVVDESEDSASATDIEDVEESEDVVVLKSAIGDEKVASAKKRVYKWFDFYNFEADTSDAETRTERYHLFALQAAIVNRPSIEDVAAMGYFRTADDCEKVTDGSKVTLLPSASALLEIADATEYGTILKKHGKIRESGALRNGFFAVEHSERKCEAEHKCDCEDGDCICFGDLKSVTTPMTELRTKKEKKQKSVANLMRSFLHLIDFKEMSAEFLNRHVLTVADLFSATQQLALLRSALSKQMAATWEMGKEIGAFERAEPESLLSADDFRWHFDVYNNKCSSLQMVATPTVYVLRTDQSAKRAHFCSSHMLQPGTVCNWTVALFRFDEVCVGLCEDWRCFEESLVKTQCQSLEATTEYLFVHCTKQYSRTCRAKGNGEGEAEFPQKSKRRFAVCDELKVGIEEPVSIQVTAKTPTQTAPGKLEFGVSKGTAPRNTHCIELPRGRKYFPAISCWDRSSPNCWSQQTQLLVTT